MDPTLLEQNITHALKTKSEEARVDSRTTARIQKHVLAAIEEETIMTKKTTIKTWKKTALAAAAICVLGSMTAIAIGRTTSASVHSSHKEIVSSYADAAAMQKQYDSAVKVVEAFSNGYTFEYAVPEHAVYTDEQGNQTAAEDYLGFNYTKDGLDRVSLSFERGGFGPNETDHTMTLEDGTVLGFSSLQNKFVPADYKATEEDLALVESGDLNLAYGSSKIEESTSLSVTWTQDGVNYCLFTFEDSLTADEMFEMAKEIAE